MLKRGDLLVVPQARDFPGSVNQGPVLPIFPLAPGSELPTFRGVEGRRARQSIAIDQNGTRFVTHVVTYRSSDPVRHTPL